MPHREDWLQTPSFFLRLLGVLFPIFRGMDGRRDRNKGRRCVNFVSAAAAAVRQGQSDVRGKRKGERSGNFANKIDTDERTDGLDVSRDGKKGVGRTRDTPTTTTRAATCARRRAQRTNCSTDRRRAKRGASPPPEPRTAPPPPLRLFTRDRENGRRRRRRRRGRRRDIAVFRFTRAVK